MEISNDAEQVTTVCAKGFSCLEKDEKDLCKIKSDISKKMLFINCLEDTKCSYQAMIGHHTLCTCPMRIANLQEIQNE